MAFALLSRLRYLVLKNNNFTVFPDVVRLICIYLDASDQFFMSHS